MDNTVVLHGKIKDTVKLHGKLRTTLRMVGQVQTGMSDIKSYDGEYVIIPVVQDDIILETNDKRMLDDVTVKKIPYAEASNRYGTTITIGG